MTTSSHCLTIIVYFPSKTRKGRKRSTGSCTSDVRYRYKTNKGVLTINLHNQGRGKHEANETWIGMGWCGARDVWAAHKD
jgi:hypothetical protein